MAVSSSFTEKVWIVLLVCSILLIVWTVFVIINADSLLPNSLEYADSPLKVEEIEKNARDFLKMSMVKPLWEEMWIGIFGLFIAIGLKNRKRWAWILGILWGVMMITNAAIQGGYEILILGWSGACIQTYIFLVLGIVVFVSLLICRKGFTKEEQET